MHVRLTALLKRTLEIGLRDLLTRLIHVLLVVGHHHGNQVLHLDLAFYPIEYLLGGMLERHGIQDTVGVLVGIRLGDARGRGFHLVHHDVAVTLTDDERDRARGPEILVTSVCVILAGRYLMTLPLV